jgi:hypothetical protein
MTSFRPFMQRWSTRRKIKGMAALPAEMSHGASGRGNRLDVLEDVRQEHRCSGGCPGLGLSIATRGDETLPVV